MNYFTIAAFGFVIICIIGSIIASIVIRRKFKKKLGKFKKAIYEKKCKETSMLTMPIHTFGNVKYREHYIRTKDGEYLCITEIVTDDAASKKPIIFCHGSFTNRLFWISKKGVGIAKFLQDSGHYSIWILDFRGHGQSPKSNNYNTNTTNQHWAYYDLPAAVDYVKTQTNQKRVSLIGHSLGGMTITCSLHYGWVNEKDVEVAILVGTQYTHGKGSIRDPLSRLIIRFFMLMYSYFPSDVLSMGNDIESCIWMEQLLDYYLQRYNGRKLIEEVRWNFNLIKDLKNPEKYREVLGPRIKDSKIVCITAEKDTVDPPAGCYQLFQQLATTTKKFIKLGKGETSNTDFTHPGMIVSKDAAIHVWPMIHYYLLHHEMREINN